MKVKGQSGKKIQLVPICLTALCMFAIIEIESMLKQKNLGSKANIDDVIMKLVSLNIRFLGFVKTD